MKKGTHCNSHLANIKFKSHCKASICLPFCLANLIGLGVFSESGNMDLTTFGDSLCFFVGLGGA